jgi:choline dehydrogenase-like flavoprotein
MSETTHFDVIIIGSGAGGGTLFQHLAPSGKRILLLERGGYLPRERDNWNSTAVFIKDKYRAKDAWFDKNGHPFHAGIQYYVGGDTKVYGAALLRLRKEDFGEVVHHDGVSPAWPLSYEDFEPYYTKAEYLYHVHGQRGTDPTEPPASAPYRYPPVSNEPRIQKLHDDLVRLGHHPFPLPLGILLDEENGKVAHTSQCIRCNRFDGFPCLVHGKADAEVLCVTPALKHSNVQLLTNAYVEKLETNASGREVAKVHVSHDGGPEEYTADVVVVACGAINSAALLLRSANDKHPRGLANSSDVVGRYYMRHNCSAFMALSVTPNPTVFQKTLALNDFYFRSDDFPYPLGEIQMLGKTDGEIIKGELPFWASWAPEMALDVMAEHSVDFWLQTEDLPRPDNRVTLDDKCKIHLALTDTNVEGHKRLIAKLKSMLKDIGCYEHLLPHTLYLNQKIPIGGTAHQNGTIRFGPDPKTSALDLNCKAHDLDNLYVVDGSFFPSCGSVNPALTIMANALRVGDHLLERLSGTRP